MGALAMAAPSGLAAQETLLEVYQPSTVIGEQMQEEQIREGNVADVGSSQHAESCRNCVGVILSIGDDTRGEIHALSVAYLLERNRPLSEHNMDIVRAHYEEQFVAHQTAEFQAFFGPEIDVQVFPASFYGTGENAVGTGVEFTVGRILYNDENGTSSFDVSEVDQELAGNVVEYLGYAWDQDPVLQARLRSEQAD